MPRSARTMEADRTLLDPPRGAGDALLGVVLDGRYRIDGVLGMGGMGVVYQATHVGIGKPVAVKVLRAEASANTQAVERFKQEAHAAAAIGNEHIIEITDFGELPGGLIYIVMELLQGAPLSSALAPKRPLGAARAIAIGLQLCDALGAAHARSIVHRDLKPENVFLTSRNATSDFVKLLDFGIAKVVGAASKLTKTGQVFGTPLYMSPEQCAGTPVDHRTDIYSTGVMLYEMTTGRVPFDGATTAEILGRQLLEEPIAPRVLDPLLDVTPELDAIIMKCLAKKPALRYSTMAELRADLAHASRNAIAPTRVRLAPVQPPRAVASMGGRAPVATTVVGVAPGRPSSFGWSARTGLLVAIVAVALLFSAVGGGVWLALRPADSDSDSDSDRAALTRPAVVAPPPALPRAVPPVRSVVPVAPVPIAVPAPLQPAIPVPAVPSSTGDSVAGGELEGQGAPPPARGASRRTLPGPSSAPPVPPQVVPVPVPVPVPVQPPAATTPGPPGATSTTPDDAPFRLPRRPIEDPWAQPRR